MVQRLVCCDGVILTARTHKVKAVRQDDERPLWSFSQFLQNPRNRCFKRACGIFQIVVI